MRFSYPGPNFILLAILALFPFFSHAQVSVTATTGTPGPTNYTTLKGAFDAVNAGTHQGDIVITISSNTTEATTATLNGSGIGAALYNKVLIKPAPGTSPVVSGTASRRSALILLNGASNITIDGSGNGTSSRDLTINNSTTDDVINIVSVGTTGITDLRVMNTNITSTSATAGGVGIAVAGVGNADGIFNNIAIINNEFKRLGYGVLLRGTQVPRNGDCQIIGNQMDAGGADAIRNTGIFTWYIDNVIISANKIGNFDGSQPFQSDCGILIDAGCDNITVSGNEVYNIVETATQNAPPTGICINTRVDGNVVVVDNTITNIGTDSDAFAAGLAMIGSSAGITFSGNRVSKIWNTNPTSNAIGILLNTTWNGGILNKAYNNFISDVAAVGKPSDGWSDNAYGIVALGPGPYQIDYNTVVMTPNNIRGNSDRPAAILISNAIAPGAIESLRNNIFVNQQSSSGANSKPVALINASPNGAAAFANIDHNDYYTASNILASDGTTDATDLTQLQTLLGGNVNSKNILPIFVSPIDFHLVLNNNAGIENGGTPLTGILDDIDKETRDAVTPDMGADELICNPPNITTPPGPQTVSVNDMASFSVTATGLGPLTYQWEVNDGSGFAPITDNATYRNSSTATLNISAASLNMNGYQYRCVVTGGCVPAATSVSALLTVAIMPQQLNFQTQTAGSIINVTYGDLAVNAAARASSGLPVTYTSSNTGVGAVDPAGQITILGAGTTIITVSQPGDARYSAATNITITIVVNKKDLRLTADDKNRAQGDPNPPLTITYNGFVNGEDAGVITVPNITTTAALNSAMGTYPIRLNGGTAANYRLILTNGTLTITAPVLRIMQEPVDKEVCERTSMLFTVTANNMPNIKYQWQQDAGSGWQDINGAINNSYVALGTVTRTLRCIVSTPATMLTTRTTQFTVHPAPAIQAAALGYTDCTGTSVQLMATGALTYEWSPLQDLSGAYTENPIASPVVNTLYTVEGRDAFGCRATTQVQVDVRQNNFKMPNAFTPNNDGNNDCFGIRSWGMLLKVDFSIYNRSGNLVFHTANASECWEGKWQGNDLPAGTYVYHIIAATECGIIQRKGTVTLIR